MFVNTASIAAYKCPECKIGTVMGLHDCRQFNRLTVTLLQNVEVNTGQNRQMTHRNLVGFNQLQTPTSLAQLTSLHFAGGLF